ncbi:hypothetical protein ABH933_002496 [Nocardia sp. GP40]
MQAVRPSACIRPTSTGRGLPAHAWRTNGCGSND